MVSFREDTKIVEQLDINAKKKGIDRSGFIRMLIREKLKGAPE